MAACAILLALPGCRQRQVPDRPSIYTNDAVSKAPVIRAGKLDPGALKSARSLAGPCSLDTVDGQYFSGVLEVSRGKPLQFRGWLPNEHDKPAGDFLVVLAGEGDPWAVPARTGAPRPDVAEARDALALGTSGFELAADLAPVPPGNYAIVLLQRAGEASLSCDTAKRLLLT